ncbi:MAG: hypothetical protein AB8D78_13605 [Akkermansiaceae bacterium]
MLATIGLLQGETLMAKVQIRYEGLDGEWLTALKAAHATVKDETVVLPDLTLREGQKGMIEMTREYILDANGPRFNAGASCYLTATIDGQTVRLSGSLVLRRPVRDPAGGSGDVLAFETRDILFNKEFRSGEKTELITVKSPGEKMIVTVTIVDATGKPRK